MSFNFPNSPINGAEYTPPGGPTYVYVAPVWKVKAGGVTEAPSDGLAYARRNTTWQAFSAKVALTSDTNFYLDGTNGSDTNSGLTGSPVKTLAQLCNVLSGYDLNNWTAIVNMAAGDYLQDARFPPGALGPGQITFVSTIQHAATMSPNLAGTVEFTLPRVPYRTKFDGIKFPTGLLINGAVGVYLTNFWAVGVHSNWAVGMRNNADVMVGGGVKMTTPLGSMPPMFYVMEQSKMNCYPGDTGLSAITLDYPVGQPASGNVCIISVGSSIVDFGYQAWTLVRSGVPTAPKFSIQDYAYFDRYNNTVYNSLPGTTAPNYYNVPYSAILTTRFTATTTWTPNANMLYCEIVCYGGGGAGGGCAVTAAAQGAAGTGGHAGAKSMYRGNPGLAAQTVTVGAAGAIGAVGAAGGNGGASSVGALCVAPGGLGGPAGAATAGPYRGSQSGPNSSGTVGNVLAGSSATGQRGWVGTSGAGACGGEGGATDLGNNGVINSSTANGDPALANTGSGGSGGSNLASIAAGKQGGAGGSGLVIITEYCHSAV
jgi:hypothetical protein